MLLTEKSRLWLLGRAKAVMASRPPDLRISDNYLERWMLYPRNRLGNIYIHRFNGDDDDVALHDHEPDNVSLVLENEYIEHFHETPLRIEWVRETSDKKYQRYCTVAHHRKQGAIVPRLAGTPHRIVLADQSKPVITMFVQGPRRRKWGFHCVHGWRHWKEYVAVTSYGNRAGKGCD